MTAEFKLVKLDPVNTSHIPALPGIAWQSLTDTFLQEYRGSTQRTYRDAWLRFLDYCEINSESTVGIVPDEDLVKAFRDSMLDTSKSPHTINCYLSAVRAFYRFLHSYIRKGLRTGNITADRAGELQLLIEGILSIGNVRTGKLPGRLPTTVDQSRDLIDSIPSDSLTDKRDRAMIALLVGCGLRRIELVRADRVDLVNRSGQMLMRIQQKGHHAKDGFVVIFAGVERLLRPWLTESPCKSLDDPLFPSLSKRDTGTRLTPRSVSRIIRKRLDTIGLKDHSTHSLRHAFATIALSDDNVDIRDVQQALGHSQITTTERYVHQNNRLKGKPEKAVNDAVFSPKSDGSL